MAVIETWLHQDLQEPVKVNYLDGNLFSNNGNGNRIGVVLTNNGEALASISGTVSGYVVTADGSTVPCTGSKSGNRASILIPAAAYQPGSIFITVFVTDGTTVTTIGAVSTTVIRSRTNAQVDPGSAVTDWTQTINAAMQSVETAAENLGGIVAVPYASITFPVPLGKYTYYNNNLYRCITPIESSESFTAAHWTQVRLGDDVSDLKSALTRQTQYVNAIENDEIISRFDWWYGFISSGVIYESTVTNTNRHTPNMFLLKKGTIVKNSYTGETRSNLRIWFYNADGSYADNVEIVYKGSQYTLTADTWCRFNLEIDSGDATATFDPNKYVIVSCDLGSALENTFRATKIPGIAGGYIGSDGTLYTEYVYNYYTDYVECKKGDTIILKCKSENATLPILLKYNSNQVFERVILPGNLTFRWFTVNIIEDGYVRLSSIGLNDPLRAYIIKAGAQANIGVDQQATIRNVFNADAKNFKTVAGFYKSDNTIDQYSLENWVSKVLDICCNAGDQFKYYGNSGYNAVGVIYFNDNDILTSYKQESGMGYETVNISIPEGCNRVKFCSCNTIANGAMMRVTQKSNNNDWAYGFSRLNGKKWCAIGDSITAGDGNNHRSYVEIISEETGIIGANKGYGGSGYYNGAGGSNQFYNRLTGDTTQYDIYTIMGSINDGSVPSLGTVTSDDLTTLGGCMNATINAIYTQNPDAKIAIISPTTAGSHMYQQQKWKDYIDFQKEFCSYWCIPYLILAGCDNLRPWDDTFNDKYFYHNPYTEDPNHGDRTHPNEEGYKFFTNQIVSFLESVI